MKDFVLRMAGDFLILKADYQYFWSNPDKCLKELDNLATKKGFGLRNHRRTLIEAFDNNYVAYEYRHEADFR